MSFSSMSDCESQTAAACLVIQNAYAYVAANSSIDLTASHNKATVAAQLAEAALGLPTGTFSNPDGGGTGKGTL